MRNKLLRVGAAVLLGASVATGATLASTTKSHALVQVEPFFTINLGGLGGGTGSVTAGDGTIYSGLDDFIEIEELLINGSSLINQVLALGSGIGQVFDDSGFLGVTGCTPSGNAGASSCSAGNVGGILGVNDATADNFLTIFFDSLTGIGVDDPGSSTDGVEFDTTDAADGNPGVLQTGTIDLILHSTAPSLTNIPPDTGAAGEAVLLASFEIAPSSSGCFSGGSGIDVDGGAFNGGTVGVCLVDTFTIISDLFIGSDGLAFDSPVRLELVDVDATAAAGDIDASGVDGDGNGTVIIGTQNDGSLTVATVVPEPATLGLMGASLVGVGLFAARRRRRNKAQAA